MAKRKSGVWDEVGVEYGQCPIGGCDKMVDFCVYKECL